MWYLYVRNSDGTWWNTGHTAYGDKPADWAAGRWARPWSPPG